MENIVGSVIENFSESQEDLRQRFLDKVIELVQLEKWSEQILKQACYALGLSGYHYRLWFANGVNDILSFLEAVYDQEMLTAIETTKIDGTTNKIAFALKVRILKTSKPKLLSMKNSAYYLRPANFAHGMRLAADTVDLIWRAASDRSLDFNYYSKRILLQGVYLSSQAYYYSDSSKDSINTEKFIESSLNQVVSSAKCLKKIPSWLNRIPVVRMFL
jgi:ubiquinone biosynthesis protein COQ9